MGWGRTCDEGWEEERGGTIFLSRIFQSIELDALPRERTHISKTE
jgi:hypothetical protein